MRAGPSWAVFAGMTQASIEYSMLPLPLAILSNSLRLSVEFEVALPLTIPIPPPGIHSTPSSVRSIAGVTPERSRATSPCSSLKSQRAMMFVS